MEWRLPLPGSRTGEWHGGQQAWLRKSLQLKRLDVRGRRIDGGLVIGGFLQRSKPRGAESG